MWAQKESKARREEDIYRKSSQPPLEKKFQVMLTPFSNRGYNAKNFK